jgi:hypothetical protein
MSAFDWRTPRIEKQSPAEKRRLYERKPAINVLIQPAWSNKLNSINTVTMLARDKTHKLLKASI